MMKIYTKYIFILTMLLSFQIPTTTKAENLINFILVDADNDSDIGQVHTNDTIYHSNTRHISIRTEYGPSPGSVVDFKFFVDNANFQKEFVAPYALNGDHSGDYIPYNPGPGQVSQSITARATLKNGNKIEETILLYFIDTTGTIPNFPSITSFTVVNPFTDEDFSTVNAGDTIYYPDGLFNLRANGNIPDGGSVLFGYSPSIDIGLDPAHRIENKVPYALFGDANGDYFDGSFVTGCCVANIGVGTATPFTKSNGGGIQGQTVYFYIRQPAPVSALKISAYPNPSADNLTVKVQNIPTEIIEVQLLDPLGALYYKNKYTLNKEELILNLKELNINQGLYYLRIRSEDGTEEMLTLFKE